MPRWPGRNIVAAAGVVVSRGDGVVEVELPARLRVDDAGPVDSGRAAWCHEDAIDAPAPRVGL